MFYVRENVPGKLLFVVPLPAECFFVEINLRKKNGYFAAHRIFTKIT